RWRPSFRSLDLLLPAAGRPHSDHEHPLFRSCASVLPVACTPNFTQRRPPFRSLAGAFPIARTPISDRWRVFFGVLHPSRDLRVFENGFMTPLRPLCDDACGG